jgi:hypothetical protein
LESDVTCNVDIPIRNLFIQLQKLHLVWEGVFVFDKDCRNIEEGRLIAHFVDNEQGNAGGKQWKIDDLDGTKKMNMKKWGLIKILWVFFQKALCCDGL